MIDEITSTVETQNIYKNMLEPLDGDDEEKWIEIEKKFDKFVINFKVNYELKEIRIVNISINKKFFEEKQNINKNKSIDIAQYLGYVNEES